MYRIVFFFSNNLYDGTNLRVYSIAHFIFLCVYVKILLLLSTMILYGTTISMKPSRQCPGSRHVIYAQIFSSLPVTFRDIMNHALIKD